MDFWNSFQAQAVCIAGHKHQFVCVYLSDKLKQKKAALPQFSACYSLQQQLAGKDPPDLKGAFLNLVKGKMWVCM